MDETKCQWLPIDTAPKDGTKILGWCNHDADPYYLDDGKRLTPYASHLEGGASSAEDGPNIVEWGGGWHNGGTWEEPAEWMPDWWFMSWTYFERPANPTHWMPIQNFDS